MTREPGSIPPRGRGQGSSFDVAKRVLNVTAVLVSFGLAYSGVRMLEDHEDTRRAVIQFVLATLFLAVGGRGLPLTDARDEGEQTQQKAEGQSLVRRIVSVGPLGAFWWALLAVAIGLGVFFRTHEIRSLPYGIWFDEAQNGIVARQILDGDHPVFLGGPTQLPALFFYAFAAGLKIFGDNITSLRAVTTAAGVLSVIFVYLTARELFDHRVGVLSAFFLAVMRWNVNFSRFAMNGIFSPLFMLTMFYFLARGLKGKGSWNFAAAGVMAAVGLQSYYSFILVPPIIVLYIVHHVIFERMLTWKRLATGARIFAAAGIIAYAPLGDWAIHHWDQFNQRANTVTITNNRTTSEWLHVAFESSKKHLLMFNADGDRNGRHNIPGAPMLDTWTGFLFVLGVGYAFWRIKSSSYFLLLLWAAVTLQSGIWSVDFEAPQAYRTVAITPAIAMLAALPLAQLWRIASARPKTGGTRRGGVPSWRSPSSLTRTAMLGGAATVTIFVLAKAGTTNYHDYFHVELVRADAWAQYATDTTFVAKEIQRYGPGPDYRVSAGFQGHPTIRFLDPDLSPDRAKRFDWALDIPASTSNDTVYLLDQTKGPFQSWLRSVYPDAAFKDFGPPLQQDPIIAYEAVVPKDQVEALQGIQATYTPDGAPAVNVREPSLVLNWTTAAPVALPSAAKWAGVLRAPEYRDYTLTFEVPGSARISLDGIVVTEGVGMLSYTGRLYKGEHTLTIDARVERLGTIGLSWDGEPIPPSAFLTYPLQGHGLLGSFYQNENWEGDPKLVELDPLIGLHVHSELDVVGRPFTAAWAGFLDVPVAGDYAFELDAVEEGSLQIDGQTVPATPGSGKTVPMEQGRHQIEVRLRNTRGGARLFLSWKSLAIAERQVIPAERFSPR